MELRHLRYFLTVAEELNFRKAAERLRISQPPLSKQIKELEHELGTLLFERAGKRIRLTEPGSFLKEEGQRLLDDAAALQRRIRLIGKNDNARLTIGYVDSIMLTVLPGLLGVLKRRMPEMSVEIVERSTEEQLADLFSGRIDIGFVRSWIGEESIDFISVGEESLSLVYPKGTLIDGVEPDRLADFSQLPFVCFSRKTAPGLVDFMLKICEEAGFAPNIEYQCDQTVSILKLVAEGLGWSILPSLAIVGIETENVSAMKLERRIAIGIAQMRDCRLPKVKEAVDIARRYVAKRLRAQNGPAEADSDPAGEEP